MLSKPGLTHQTLNCNAGMHVIHFAIYLRFKKFVSTTSLFGIVLYLKKTEKKQLTSLKEVIPIVYFANGPRCTIVGNCITPIGLQRAVMCLCEAWGSHAPQPIPKCKEVGQRWAMVQEKWSNYFL